MSDLQKELTTKSYVKKIDISETEDAIKKFHKQVIEKSLLALYTQNVNEREFSSTLLAFDSSLINEAKECIRAFSKNFSKNLPGTNKKDSVYCLSMQFFRTDRKDNLT